MAHHVNGSVANAGLNSSQMNVPSPFSSAHSRSDVISSQYVGSTSHMSSSSSVSTLWTKCYQLCLRVADATLIILFFISIYLCNVSNCSHRNCSYHSHSKKIIQYSHEPQMTVNLNYIRQYITILLRQDVTESPEMRVQITER